MKRKLKREEKKKLAGIFAGIITFIIFLVWLQFSSVPRLGNLASSFGKITNGIGKIVSNAKAEFKFPKKEEVKMCGKQQETKTAYEKK